MRVQRFNDERLTYAFIHGAWDDAHFPLEVPRVWEGSG